MIPNIGEVCKFTFKPIYNSLDGIYKVLSISKLQEYIDDGVNIIDTYKATDLDEIQFEIDYPNIKDSYFLKIQNVLDENVYYVTDHFYSKLPNPNIHEYLRLAFVYDLGIYNNTDNIEWIKNHIKQEILSTTGIETDPELYELESVWLTEAEYSTIEAGREANKDNVNNHYTDKLKLIEENNRLKALVQAYEQTIINLQP
jgi:hypothetical protein